MLDLVDIKVDDPMRELGVVYIGQYGTSGYATAAKGYIFDFLVKGIPVNWVPLKFDDSELSDDLYYNVLVKTAIGKKLPNPPGTVILHCTPDLWGKYISENPDKFSNKNIIGYTVWETNRLPNEWVDHINNNVNEVWCPSSYNKNVFVDSGIKIPIRIVPHVFLRGELPDRNRITIKSCAGEVIVSSPNVYTFYSISEMNERKNVEGLILAYCKAFTSENPVRLVLKVHHKNYSSENVMYCVSKITNILKDFPNHAPLFVISKNLSEMEMLSLHSLGDCYVSLTRSEAFGLTIFDALNYGKKIVVTGYGGQVDYLGEKYPGLVSYELGDVKNMETFSHGYYMQGTQQWATPNIDHSISIMKGIANGIS